MRINTDALTLKTSASRENDLIATLLTSEYGVVSAFANGAKKMNGRLRAAVQSLCYANFSIYKNRDAYIIDDARAVEIFFGLREDISRLALAQYFCALVYELVPEAVPSRDFLRLTLNSLHLLEKRGRSNDLLKAVTELKYMVFSGFAPDLSVYPRPGEEPRGEIYFNIADGRLYDAGAGKGGERINSTVLAAMRHICASPIEKCFFFSIPEKDERRLAQICEKFVASRTRGAYKALNFYKSVI